MPCASMFYGREEKRREVFFTVLEDSLLYDN
jgi:hypothetical protein